MCFFARPGQETALLADTCKSCYRLQAPSQVEHPRPQEELGPLAIMA